MNEFNKKTTLEDRKQFITFHIDFLRAIKNYPFKVKVETRHVNRKLKLVIRTI